MKKWINLIGFQTTWFAAVLGAAKGLFWAGPLVLLLWLTVHVSLSDRPGLEIRIGVIAFFIGLFVESLMMGMAVYTPKGIQSNGFFPPGWMLALWVNFGTLVNGALVWLKQRYLLGAIMAFLGAPTAYYSGHQLEALTFIEPIWKNLVVLALAWTVSLPLLFFLSVKMGRPKKAA